MPESRCALVRSRGGGGWEMMLGSGKCRIGARKAPVVELLYQHCRHVMSLRLHAPLAVQKGVEMKTDLNISLSPGSMPES